MVGYLIRRLIQTIVVTLIVTIITFIMLHLVPGGEVRQQASFGVSGGVQ